GNLLWAKKKFNYISPSSSNTEVVPSNLCFANQKLYISGNVLKETIVIDTISVTLPIGHNAVFLASFSLDGYVEWLRVAGYPEGGEGSNISCDRIGNIYLTGTMWGSSGIFGDDTLHSNYGDCFLAKYSSNGIYQWARGIQPSGFARGHAVSVDRENNVYFTGTFMGEAHFGPFLLVSDATSIDMMDMFLAKYNIDGECIGVRQYSEGSSIVTVGYSGNILQGGAFYNTLDIGPQPLISRGESDVFIAACSPITGIIQPKPESSNTLLIYANPNTGQCRITIPDEFQHEKELSLEIYDQTGRLIQKVRIKIIGDSIELDIRAQAKGMYNAILSNGKKYYSGKIIFE
ncbi:MAG: T9SS type A sorting domain-containing protein, partial [Bacteroidota bacterium]